MWEKVLLLLVPFRSQIFDAFLTTFWTVRLSVCLSRVNLTLVITFQPVEIRLSYYTCWFLVTRPFCPYQKFDLVTLTLIFDLLLKKLNLGYNFWTKRDKAFILHMLVPCDKTFLPVPKNLTLWPWPWLLTYFWKKLNLGYNLWTKIHKSFIAHICIPCGKTFLSIPKNFDLVTLTWTFDLLLKKLNLGYNLWTKRDKSFIVQICIPCGKTFLSIPKMLTMWPWLLTYFWKKLTLTITFEPKVIGL